MALVATSTAFSMPTLHSVRLRYAICLVFLAVITDAVLFIYYVVIVVMVVVVVVDDELHSQHETLCHP